MGEGHFADRLLETVERKRSHVVVGFDPDFALLPPELVTAHPPHHYPTEEERKAACYRDFLLRLAEGLAELAVAVKIQIAYFEALGSPGYRLYEELASLCRALGYLVIADVKRGDIGSTAEAYATAHLDKVGADAITVNPYFGADGVEPFLRRAREGGKGVFLLVKTSNPGSADLQDRVLESGEPLYMRVAALVNKWGEGTEGRSGYRSVGAVVGGTHPGLAEVLRAAMPQVPFLVPGYGAQGATADALAQMFDAGGSGAVVNSARAILYAYKSRPSCGWLEAAVEEAKAMKEALWKAAGRA